MIQEIGQRHMVQVDHKYDCTDPGNNIMLISFYFFIRLQQELYSLLVT